MSEALFDYGQLVATPGALGLLAEYHLNSLEFLNRHITGDWGDVDSSDAKANELALSDGSRLFSSYRIGDTDKIWVITEAEFEGKRASTCILLPSEY